MHGDEPVRKSLTAMCAQNMLRVYCQSNAGDIEEYTSAGSPVDFARKLLGQVLPAGGLSLGYSPTRGPFRRSIPASGLGGVVVRFKNFALQIF
jgi:hypothetical protein